MPTKKKIQNISSTTYLNICSLQQHSIMHSLCMTLPTHPKLLQLFMLKYTFPYRAINRQQVMQRYDFIHRTKINSVPMLFWPFFSFSFALYHIALFFFSFSFYISISINSFMDIVPLYLYVFFVSSGYSKAERKVLVFYYWMNAHSRFGIYISSIYFSGSMNIHFSM